MNSVGERFGNFRPRDHGRQRSPAADPFGHRDDVGLHAEIIERLKMRAGSPDPTLDFIGDAQPTMLTNDVVNDFEIITRWNDGSADALNAFGDEDRHLATRLIFDHVLHVVRALQIARWIFQVIRTAVAVTRHRVLDGPHSGRRSI